MPPHFPGHDGSSHLWDTIWAGPSAWSAIPSLHVVFTMHGPSLNIFLKSMHSLSLSPCLFSSCYLTQFKLFYLMCLWSWRVCVSGSRMWTPGRMDHIFPVQSYQQRAWSRAWSRAWPQGGAPCSLKDYVNIHVLMFIYTQVIIRLSMFHTVLSKK